MTAKKIEKIAAKELLIDFSIIICTYNQAVSLNKALLSINNSKHVTSNNVELLVVINNSKDNTVEICKEFSVISKFPFRYVVEKQQGLSFARNRGIKESKGRILIFTDDDVLVPEQWLSNIIGTFYNEEPDCVFGKILPEWNGKKPDWFSSQMSPAYALLDYGDQKLLIDSYEKEFYGANFSIKKEILNKLGGFNTELGRMGNKLFIGEETQIFKYLVNSNSKIVYNPDIFLYHVIHEERKTKEFIKRYYKDISVSIAHMAVNNSKRKILGIPPYKIKEIIVFFVSVPYKVLLSVINNNTTMLFFLRLQSTLQMRVIYSCLKIYILNRKKRYS